MGYFITPYPLFFSYFEEHCDEALGLGVLYPYFVQSKLKKSDNPMGGSPLTPAAGPFFQRSLRAQSFARRRVLRATSGAIEVALVAFLDCLREANCFGTSFEPHSWPIWSNWFKLRIYFFVGFTVPYSHPATSGFCSRIGCGTHALQVREKLHYENPASTPQNCQTEGSWKWMFMVLYIIYHCHHCYKMNFLRQKPNRSYAEYGGQLPTWSLSLSLGWHQSVETRRMSSISMRLY